MDRFKLIPDETKIVDGHRLQRISRLIDGERGGFVETKANLSEDGTAWLHKDSVAYEGARVKDDAQVYGRVFGTAVVGGKSTVFGRVFGRATVSGSATVYGEVLDDAVVDGTAVIYGKISHDTHITEGTVIGSVP